MTTDHPRAGGAPENVTFLMVMPDERRPSWFQQQFFGAYGNNRAVSRWRWASGRGCDRAHIEFDDQYVLMQALNLAGRPVGYARYRYWGQRRVDGYTESPVFDMLKVLDAAQRAGGIRGSVVEIGVHHGRLLIGMHLLQRADEKSMAIDLFGDQALNIDQSGLGDLGKFQQNLKKWSHRPIVIHQGDSTLLKLGDVPEMTGARLFSVDGGHSADTVKSDMKLAEDCICSGGIVIADDVFNQHWPDVCVGTMDYLRGGGLVPFGIGYNKTLFTQPEYAERYRDALGAGFKSSRMTAGFPEKSFAGHEVVILVAVPKTPAHFARSSPFARKVYRKLLSYV